MSHIKFSLHKADVASYQAFIDKLRALLTGSTLRLSNNTVIPVLRHNVRDSDRFILVDLSNYDNDKVTVAIDVVNVYIVGYLVDKKSYFLQQHPNDNTPINVLFPKTERQPEIPFTGHYNALERAFIRDRPHLRDQLKGREVRELISLGLIPLNDAINNLRKNIHVAEALLVIIQMVAEAARFRFIEGQVRHSIKKGENFEAGPATLGLETNWGALSARIQDAKPDGSFTQPVFIESISNTRKRVDNINSDIISGIALIQYVHVQAPVPTRAGDKKGSTSTGPSGGGKK